MADLQDLRCLIYSHPIIDNHAHNILRKDTATDYARYPLEAVTSEAQGEALIDHATKTLAHHRAVNQLAGLYGCEPEWESIKAARQKVVEIEYNGLVKRCLEGTHTLLIDDGLTDGREVEVFSWHDAFTSSPTKTLVRIEAVAAKQMEKHVQDLRNRVPPITIQTVQIDHFFSYPDFREGFVKAIQDSLDDPNVAGFKSVICYRTGLKDIKWPSQGELQTSFFRILSATLENGESRICDKPLNDWILRMTLRCIQRKWAGTGSKKPIQFHTGLGDTDIDLSLSNPAHLQSLIEEFRDVDFVLLHSSYPYTREAGYLASMYSNAYLDIGEVFPMISRDGQLSILRQSLELVPTCKILWSTDGHFHPETYLLANKQFREIMDTVLVECVEKQDFTFSQAMDAAKDIMFNNSNLLYKLNQTPKFSLSDTAQCNSGSLVTSKKASSILDTFLRSNPHVEFIWAIFIDYTATIRVRMFSIREFMKLAGGKRRVGITLAVFNILQTDAIVPPHPLIAGQFYLKPDLDTLSVNIGLSSNSATVMTFWETEDGGPQDGCPRLTLENIVNRCETQFNLKLLCGFEVEVVFMEKFTSDEGLTVYKPWLTNHSWSNMTSDTRRALPLIEEIVRELAQIDIHVEQFHAESSPGQFEFILPPDSPLAAVDTLLKARQTIVHLAERHGLRATLYPRPYSSAAGTAAHVHISINPPTKEASFLAGLLNHLPAILPFTLPQDASYERVKEGIWAGGVWVAWGRQNRETPVRGIRGGHWEIKSMDGLANPYLGVAAIIAGGYLGMRSELELKTEDCSVDTASLSLAQREALGIQARMPTSLDQALAALEADTDLQSILGKWVEKYIGVRRGEHDMLSKMGKRERKTWLIERY
ncbi:hypothetical protein D8B26_005206 [Coccidioides posadasii str. Silveira]|uniref:Glutamine synthetase n=1 Tax=Coccidioides posadasii (strain RMSCC 757 / Silveira) TaxID=443226 RepID=E9D677_COCPS|nr:glutamine synthetase [Coccidioides posadasii str. Silveira]QVM10548.1 hypothetical protein D8B26_005206 [Coccidioides posadasii str. Silveira]